MPGHLNLQLAPWCPRVSNFKCNFTHWMIFAFFLPGTNMVQNNGRGHVVSSDSVSSYNRQISEITSNISTTAEDLTSNLKKSNNSATNVTIKDSSKQQKVSPCPPSIRKPLAASTPALFRPSRNICTPSVNRPIEKRTYRPTELSNVTGQHDNYSVLPEGNLIYRV